MYYGHSQYTETIYDASVEADAGCLIRINCRTRYFSDLVFFHEDLRQHLVVENKIITIIHETDIP